MKRICKYLSYGAAAVLIVMMMAATIVEKLKGTPVAFDVFYHNPLFITLWAVTAVAGLIYLVLYGTPKRVVTMALHVGLVVILVGAFVTYAFGETGMIHLREGEAKGTFELEDESMAELPFSIRLDEFAIEYHHGSKMPSDYRSEITFLPEGEAVTISMNNIAKYRGYRFYQADYDEDGKGSILAVSHDPWGVGITYAGYLILLLSMIGFFFQRDTAFHDRGGGALPGTSVRQRFGGRFPGPGKGPGRHVRVLWTPGMSFRYLSAGEGLGRVPGQAREPEGLPAGGFHGNGFLVCGFGQVPRTCV